MSATWHCPRCGKTVELASPTAIPANCPKCKYPDIGEQVVDDLEAEVGEEERRLALAPVAPAPAVTAAPGRMPPIDAGWLTVVVRQWLYDGEKGRRVTRRVSMTNAAAVAAEVAGMYNDQDRWPMLCGCLIGTHDDDRDAMRAAHPDRRI